MTAPTSAVPTSREHIGGLDTLRFFLATWVVLCHFGPAPIPVLQSANHGLLLVIRLLYNNLFNGPAAVIAFFVISGFCIHYGVGRSTELFLPAYFTRRWIRTLVPMAAAVGFAQLAGVKLGLFSASILWSLLCEEIYYLLYPLLLALRTRLSWSQMAVIGFMGSIAVAMSQPRALEYPVFGPWLNWILGFPCWVLGCLLAEHVMRGELPRVRQGEIWLWRLGVWGVGSVLSILRFHAGIGYPWTLNAFALLVLPWLGREIAAARQHKPPPTLEAAGRWSYSLYLMHLTFGAFAAMLMPAELDGRAIMWIARVLSAMVGSYAFYRVVERPAHRFARIAYRWCERLQIRETVRDSLTVST